MFSPLQKSVSDKVDHYPYPFLAPNPYAMVALPLTVPWNTCLLSQQQSPENQAVRLRFALTPPAGFRGNVTNNKRTTNRGRFTPQPNAPAWASWCRTKFYGSGCPPPGGGWIFTGVRLSLKRTLMVSLSVLQSYRFGCQEW